MNQRCSKHIVYIYSGERISEEMDFDARGLLTFTAGDIVSKHGACWKIESVEPQGIDNPKQIPTIWVYLTRVVVN